MPEADSLPAPRARKLGLLMHNHLPAPACATLSVEEAAGVVGISRSSLYALVRSGCVPHLRFGRVIRIPRQSLDEWLCRLADDSLRAGAEGVR